MKWLKRLSIVLFTLVLIFIGIYILSNETLPEGQQGPEAEEMADQMLKVINYDAWMSTGAIEWDFGGRQRHVWDRDRHLAQVSWGDHEVLIDIDGRRGIVTKGSDSTDPTELSQICLQAWKYWANDSFWLNPIAKIRDPGTSRSIVESDGEKALLISYNQGGVTPGDSYLWFVDDNYMPTKWKMWVSIIPIGGISTTWEDWIELPTGARISTSHYNMLTLELKDIKAAVTLEALKGEDIFSPLLSSDSQVVSF